MKTLDVVRTVGVSIVLGAGALVLVLLWAGPESFQGFGSTDPGWLSVALGLLAGSWLLAGLRLHLLVRRVGGHLGILRAVRLHLVGLFVSAVTPGGAGGMPAVVLALVGRGVPQPRAWSVGVAATSADLAFIGWATPVALLWLGLSDQLPPRGWVLTAAFAVSVLALLASFTLIARQQWLHPLARLVLRGPLFRWRRHILRGIDRMLVARDELTATRWTWHAAFHSVVGAAWLTLFGVLWAVGRGVGLEVEVGTVLSGLTLIQGIGALVPTPGGSGVFEVGASLALRGAANVKGVAVAVVLWRAMTFYSVLLLGPAFGGYELAKRATTHSGDS